MFSGLLKRTAAGLLALPLASFGFVNQDEAVEAWPVTEGAAAGYVPDEACASCHEGIWDSYQEVGMAQAFKRVRVPDLIEDFENAHFFHEASGNHYRMEVRGEEVFQRRYRLDPNGKEYAILERKLAWVMGSGNHGRNYFYRTDLGELYQLPLVWYSQENRWGMAPGYDKPDHYDFGRQIDRRCMACHNAYPEVPTGSDLFGQPQLFPKDLPEGIGCQRCHGPGAEHVQLAERDEASDEELRAAIANPSNFPPTAREDLCNQCHLQPTTSIESVVSRFDVGSYAFRPGMLLEETQFPINTKEPGSSSERFEINHHAYRLNASRCYQESQGELTCLTCHDPHRVVPAERRVEYYRAKCLSCHQPDVCSKNPSHMQSAGVEDDDCIGCHMPMHRPREVVSVLMTDHKIRRELAPKDWIAERPEETLPVLGSSIYRPERLEGDPHADLYHALGRSKSGNPLAVLELKAQLENDAAEITSAEPWLALGDKLFEIGRPREAVTAYRRAVKLNPKLVVAHVRLGSTLGSLGDRDEALVELARALELDPNQPDAHQSAGLILSELERHEEAITHFKRVIELRPHNFEAKLELANLYGRTGLLRKAVSSFRAARAADPRIPSAHDNLGLALRHQKKWKLALNAWKLGVECVPDDPSLNRHLAELLLTAPQLELRSPAEALIHAERAAELSPEDPTSMLLLAVALLETGDFAGAEREATRAGNLEQSDGDWRRVAAQALFKRGEPSAAREMLRFAGRATNGADASPLRSFIATSYARLPK